MPLKETEAKGAMRWNELPGKQFGPYEIIEEVGRGGTSRVYKALDHNEKREIAFKIIPNDADDRVAFIQRFKRETEIVKKLKHPNIVPIFDADETEEFVFQAMELVTGVTLRHRVAQRMSAQEVALYMIQAAEALQHAHALGIVHRDVKPSNMLLPYTNLSRLLLTDFGTAKILGARGPTKTGATIGTPEYMSPEQAQGQEVDQRSDIYSLGCTLYEALAGRPPFVGATPVSVLYQHVHTQPTYIRSYNSEVPRDLWMVIKTCLAKRPSERYGSAKQLVEDLRPFAEGLIQPTPAPWRAPATSRLESMDFPSQRKLRAQTSRPLDGASPQAPMPPPFTPAPAPIIPGALGSRPTQRPASQATPFGQPAGGFVPRGPTVPSGPIGPRSQPPLGAPGSTSQPLAPLGGAQDDAPFGPWSAPPNIPPGRSSYDPRPSVTSGPYSHLTGGPNRPAPPPAYRSQVSGPIGQATGDPYRAQNNGYRGPHSGSLRGPQSGYGPRAAVASGPRPRGRTAPIPRKRSLPSLATVAAAVVATLMLAGAFALGAAGLGLLPGQASAKPPAKATVAPTSTPAPTDTAAPPTATVTPNAQALLDRQAASAFKAITIASFSDLYCSAGSQASFSSGQAVFVNLCVGSRSMPGPVTVEIRSHGSVIRVLMNHQYLARGGSYSQGHTLGAGSYDMLVQVDINGTMATAKDFPFTVN